MFSLKIEKFNKCPGRLIEVIRYVPILITPTHFEKLPQKKIFHSKLNYNILYTGITYCDVLYSNKKKEN